MSKAAGKKGAQANGKGKKKEDDLDALFAEMELDKKPAAAPKGKDGKADPSAAAGAAAASAPSRDPTGCTPYTPFVPDESKRVEIRGLGKRPSDWKELETKSGEKQTNPPRIPVADFFPSGHFPEGQIMPHSLDTNAYRTSTSWPLHSSRGACILMFLWSVLPR